MSAQEKDHLSLVAAIVKIAIKPSSFTSITDDLSNHASVITALDALSYERMASVTDLAFGVSTSDKKVEQRADDTGIIYSAYTPGVKVSMNWFESGNLDAIQMMLGTEIVDVAASGGHAAYSVTGQNIKPQELPQVVIKIEGMNDANGHKEVLYLFDSGMSGELVKKFVDIVRTNEIPSSALEFKGNEGGFWLHKTERIGA